MKVFVEHMINNNGNAVKNQFITHTSNKKIFQSYETIIATIDDDGTVTLDGKCWNYSRTTSKYRNMFLNETTKSTEEKIKDGTFKLANLNTTLW
jgi:hypothetical protein